MSKKTAEQWRELWKAHREQYLARQRERRASMSPTKREVYLAKRRADYAKMTDTERAYEYARGVEYRAANRERIKERKREYYRKNGARLRNLALRWKEMNYQRYLAQKRAYDERRCEAEGREYKPRESVRVPAWVKCPAQMRHLRMMAEARKQSEMVDFQTAIRSGLTVGRFAV